MAKLLVAITVAVGFIGGLITLGALGALQADTPAEINDTVKPYRFAWFAWSLEVFVLVFAIFALIVDYSRLNNALLSLVATSNVFVINLISANIYITDKLPGSNGSATRGNIAIAGLIIVAIANFLIILFTAAFNLSEKPRTSDGRDGKSVDV